MKAKKQRKLITFDWAMKRLLRSKANFDILEGFLSELLDEDIDLVFKIFQIFICLYLSLIHISEPTRQAEISYAVFCLKKKKK